MAINRGPWNALVDDDGSNLVGSVWNKAAIKDVILDPVDAAFVTPAYGTFLAIDRSGAGLVFPINICTVCQIGRLVSIWMHVTWPVTSNGSQASLGGFPLVSGSGTGGVQAYGVTRQWYFPGANDNYVLVRDPVTVSPISNAQMSGSIVIVYATYLTP